MTETKEVKKRRHFTYTDPILTACVLFLTLFGTIMVLSASISSKTNIISEVMSAAVRQVAFLIISYAIYFVIVKFFTFELLNKWILVLLVIEIGMLIVTRAFGSIGGSYAWIRIGPLSLQPSEFAKVLMVMTIVVFMCDIKTTKVKKAWTIIRYPVLVFLTFAFLIVVYQHDFGSGFACLAIGAICFLVPSHKLFKPVKIGILIIAVLGIVLTALFMTEGFRMWLTSDELRAFMANNAVIGKIWNKVSYQFYRFLSAGNPLWDRFGYSQELLNSLLGMSRGNLTGIGLGNSIQKFGYLASASADYIFPVIVEELGLIGIACVFIPYTIMFYRLVKYALLVKSEKEKVVLIGTFTYFFIHMFLNIGGVSAFIPLTGVPLLLVSRGGSAMMASLALMGVSQNIIRKYNYKNDENNSR